MGAASWCRGSVVNAGSGGWVDDAPTRMHAPHRRSQVRSSNKGVRNQYKMITEHERDGFGTYIKWRGGRHRFVVGTMGVFGVAIVRYCFCHLFPTLPPARCALF